MYMEGNMAKFDPALPLLELIPQISFNMQNDLFTRISLLYDKSHTGG